ncbi:hypothetical protein ACHAWF_016866 [Thalassiosira exigua]
MTTNKLFGAPTIFAAGPGNARGDDDMRTPRRKKLKTIFFSPFDGRGGVNLGDQGGASQHISGSLNEYIADDGQRLALEANEDELLDEPHLGTKIEDVDELEYWKDALRQHDEGKESSREGRHHARGVNQKKLENSPSLRK